MNLNDFFCFLPASSLSSPLPAALSSNQPEFISAEAPFFHQSIGDIAGPSAAELAHGVVLVGTLRLDNRAALTAQLAIEVGGTQPSDEALVLAAYRRWGRDFPAQLHGDFAVVLWDGPRKQLLLARDHLGVKPLYWRRSEIGFWCSNRIDWLRDLSGQPTPSLLDRSVATYLTEGELYSSRETFYVGIEKLPAGTTAALQAGDWQEQQYWSLESALPPVSVPATQWPEQLSQLITEAVNDRTRDGVRCATHLSGGLDSSLITALVARKGQLALACNWQCSGEGPAEEAAASLARQLGAPYLPLPFSDTELLSLLQGFDIGLGDTSTLWYEHTLRRRLGDAGLSVLLSGWGGDQFASYGGNAGLVSLFWSGHPLAALRHVFGMTELSLWRRGRRAAGLFLRSPLRALLGKQRSSMAGMDVLDCCHPDFQAWARARRRPPVIVRPWSMRDEMLRDVRQGHLQNRLESWTVAGSAAGVDYRFPLLDRRILDFVRSLPPSAFFHRGENRHVFRQAARGILPDAIRRPDFKLEVERVAHLLDQETRALVTWARQDGGANIHDTPVQREALHGLIRNLEDEGSAVTLQRIRSLRAAMQSVLLLGIGQGSLVPLGDGRGVSG